MRRWLIRDRDSAECRSLRFGSRSGESFQLSLLAMLAPLESCSSSVVSSRAFGSWLLSDGPRARTRICRAGRLVARDKPADQNVVARFDKTARADVRQNGICGSAAVVHFHERDTGGVIAASQDRRVGAGCERPDDRGLPVIARGKASGFDLERGPTNPSNCRYS